MNVRNDRWRKILCCVGGLAVAALLAELGLRMILFGGLGAGWALRRPSRYADYQSEEDHYKLAARWRGGSRKSGPSFFQPALGWVSEAIDPASLTHRDLAGTGERQLVVLYGDSYSHCVTEPGTRYQDYVENSGHGRTHQLLNFGVNGFGVDQVALLLEATIDDLVERQPIVLIGIFLDDDLDRCSLTLRGYPKPKFELRDSALQITGTPVPSFATYLEQHPLAIRSYLWRLLTRGPLRGTNLGPPDRSEEGAKLAKALLDRIIDGLESRSLRVGFVLFEGEDRTASAAPVEDWRVASVAEVLDRRGVRHLSTRDVLRQYEASTGQDVRALFGNEGELANHFTARGNEIVAGALMTFVDEISMGTQRVNLPSHSPVRNR